jgi:hypothetical protein
LQLLGVAPPAAPLARSGSLPLLQHLQQSQQQQWPPVPASWQALQRSHSEGAAASLQVLSPQPQPPPQQQQQHKQPRKQQSKLPRVPSASSQGPSPATLAARKVQPLQQLLQLQQAAAVLLARELAQQSPLAAGLAGGAAFLRLQPAAGSALEWGMRHLCCPAHASMADIAQVGKVSRSPAG